MKRLVPAGLAGLIFGIILFGAVTFPPSPEMVLARSTQSNSSNAPVNTSGLPIKVASGQTTINPGAITTQTCVVQTGSATGTLTTDSFQAVFASDPTALTGYAPLTTGSVSIYMYVTANTVNFKVCNPTSGTITPSSVVLNWMVER